ncbi:MAG TPA: MFS transporter, partial [Candidatus Deferrimicrobiaceae bacterium]|nr:MFS transporter [Candidatus Deferrimicrobiaceae bacterium]
SAMLAMPYYVLIPVVAKDTLGGGADTYGILMSAAGVGAVLGSLLSASGWAVRRKGLALTAGSLSFPLLLLSFSFSRNYILSVCLLTAIGFSFVLQNASANSLLQSIVPDELRGRVMAVYVSLFLGLMRTGGLLLGLLAAATSSSTALAAASVASLAGGAAVYLKFPELRRME